MTKVLVTGSAGFIGSHVVDILLAQKCKVFGLDDLSGGFKTNINPKSNFIKIDLRDSKKTIELILKIKPEIIYHLAADATEGRSQFTPIQSTERNLDAYLNVLVGSIKAKVKRIVLASSMSVYGDQKPPFIENMYPKPVDIYGVSKTAMELNTQILASVHGFEYSIVRPHNVYGPKQNMQDPYRNVLAIFINRMLQKQNFFIYGDGNQKRSFSYIDDVAPYIVKCGFSKNAKNQIINIGPSKAYTINEIANFILSYFFEDLDLIPKKLRPIYLPDRPQEVKYALCSSQKAKDLLGFKESIPINVGIKKMIEWAKLKGPQKFEYLNELELASPKIPVTWKKKLI